ncbi:POTRA domain-containing protein, partial [Acinetobacter baumannii]
TFTVDEGSQYKIGDVDLQSSLPASVDANAMKSALVTRPGDLYNVEDIDKSVEAVTQVAARQGFAFAQVRPRVVRDY